MPLKYSLSLKADILSNVATVGIKQAACQSGVSERTIRRWIEADGSFPVQFVKESNELMLKVLKKLNIAVEKLNPSDPKAVMTLIALAKVLGEMNSYYDELSSDSAQETYQEIA